MMKLCRKALLLVAFAVLVSGVPAQAQQHLEFTGKVTEISQLKIGVDGPDTSGSTRNVVFTIAPNSADAVNAIDIPKNIKVGDWVTVYYDGTIEANTYKLVRVTRHYQGQKVPKNEVPSDKP